MNRNRKTAVWQALLMGFIGGQKFYLGQNGAGVACFSFAFTGIPLLAGFYDAFRWSRMSDRHFEARYGVQTIPFVSSDRLRLRRDLFNSMLLIWKVAYLMSWLVVPITLGACTRLDATTAYTGSLVALVGLLPVLTWASRRARNPLIRYLLDPVDQDRRGMPARPTGSFENWMYQVRAYGWRDDCVVNRKRSGLSFENEWRRPCLTGTSLFDESPTEEPQYVNPGSGYTMPDGPGGFDAGGYLWGHGPLDDYHSRQESQSHHDSSFNHGFSNGWNSWE